MLVVVESKSNAVSSTKAECAPTLRVLLPKIVPSPAVSVLPSISRSPDCTSTVCKEPSAAVKAALAGDRGFGVGTSIMLIPAGDSRMEGVLKRLAFDAIDGFALLDLTDPDD